MMSFTGYLLPFDQRSFWATTVGVAINGTGPLVGPYLSDFLRAGPEFGVTTLSRFYCDPHAAAARPHRRADRRAPVPRRAPRHDRPAVDPRATPIPSCARTRREPAREGGLPPRVLDPEVAGQAVLPLRDRQGQLDGGRRDDHDHRACRSSSAPSSARRSTRRRRRTCRGRSGTSTSSSRSCGSSSRRRSSPLAAIGVPTICMILLFLLPFYDRSPERRPERRPIAMAAAFFTIAAMAFLTYEGAIAGSPNQIDMEPPASVVAAGAETLRHVRVGQAGRRAVRLPGLPQDRPQRQHGPGPGPVGDRRAPAAPGDRAHARQPDGADAGLHRAAAQEARRPRRVPRAAEVPPPLAAPPPDRPTRAPCRSRRCGRCSTASPASTTS